MRTISELGEQSVLCARRRSTFSNLKLPYLFCFVFAFLCVCVCVYLLVALLISYFHYYT